MNGSGKKVVVAMSGGVDSSVAAALLQREGYEVMGVFMRLGSPKGVEGAGEMQNDECRVQNEKRPSAFSPSPGTPEEGRGGGSSSFILQPSALNSSLHPSPPPEYQGRGLQQAACDTSGKNKQGCCSVLDAVDARRVAGMLGIPFYVLNFEEDFGRVIDYFVDEYNRGRTPNPCVRCNDWLKFGKLAQYAEAVGADFVASGHYARVGIDPMTGEKALMRGVDHKKDQSYVLFGMSRWAMEHTLLPIGEYEKHEVRGIAEELKLPVFNKPDSQEICFVPNQDYAGLVERRSPENFREGELVGMKGEVLGKHGGHQHFTIGQRKGVGMAFGRPIYVVGIDAAHNRVMVGEKEDLLRKELVASQVNLVSSRLRLGAVAMKCTAKIRYNHLPQAATVEVLRTLPPSPGTPGEGRGEGINLELRTENLELKTRPHPNPLPEYRARGQESDLRLRVTFDEPQAAITPGQAVVVYDGNVLLGGG